MASEFAAYRLRATTQLSTANNSLRVLRRILNLAMEWVVRTTAPKIKVLPGERRRELQNFIERSVILTEGTVLRPPLSELSAWAEVESPEAVTLEDAQRDHIRKTLERTNWVLAGPRGAATRLGMKRSTLQYRMRRLGITRTIKQGLEAIPESC